MQLRNWILGSAVSAVLASCGEASSNTNNPDSTTTTETRTSSRKVVVPPPVQTSFEQKYPEAKDVNWDFPQPVVEAPIDWEWTEWPAIDTNDYVAHFNSNNSDYWVWYDDGGNWIGTVEEVSDNSGLPPAVNNVIKTQFPGYTIKSIDKENDKNRTAYEIQMENGEDKMKALITENGQVLKKKGKENGVKIKEKNNPKDSLK